MNEKELLAALEAERERVEHYRGHMEAYIADIQAERAARRKDRVTVDAGLREIAPVLDAAADQAASLNEAGMSADLDAAYAIARDLLERP